MKFTELELPEFILKAVEKQGFEETTEIQTQCIPLIMQGLDVIGKSQTGSGKTFAYGIPAIEMIDNNNTSVQVLVVCPTRELAMQVCDEFKKVTEFNQSIRAIPIYGGSNMSTQITALKRNAKIVVGTPGRLMDHLRRKTLKLNELKMIVLDEADEMLNMGFKEDIETILQSVNKDHQTVMFSATMPKPILDITNQFMKNPKLIEIGNRLQTVSTIEQKFIYHDKKEALIKILKDIKPEVGIVFCNTIRMVESVTKTLCENDFLALALHGDMRQSNRKKNMTDLKSGKAKILVGTDVAARGIDIKNVDIVLNYDLPYDVEYYIHRIGRTGRAGCNGKAITLINNKAQLNQIAVIEKETKSNITQILLDGDKMVYGETKGGSSTSFARTSRSGARPTSRVGKSSSSTSSRPSSTGSRQTSTGSRQTSTGSRPYSTGSRPSSTGVRSTERKNYPSSTKSFDNNEQSNKNKRLDQDFVGSKKPSNYENSENIYKKRHFDNNNDERPRRKYDKPVNSNVSHNNSTGFLKNMRGDKADLNRNDEGDYSRKPSYIQNSNDEKFINADKKMKSNYRSKDNKRIDRQPDNKSSHYSKRESSGKSYGREEKSYGKDNTQKSSFHSPSSNFANAKKSGYSNDYGAKKPYAKTDLAKQSSSYKGKRDNFDKLSTNDNKRASAFKNYSKSSKRVRPFNTTSK